MFRSHVREVHVKSSSFKSFEIINPFQYKYIYNIGKHIILFSFIEKHIFQHGQESYAQIHEEEARQEEARQEEEVLQEETRQETFHAPQKGQGCWARSLRSLSILFEVRI